MVAGSPAAGAPERRRALRASAKRTLQTSCAVTRSEPIAPFVRYLTAVFTTRGKFMKITTTLAVAIGLAGLAACNQSPREEAADNMEANAEMTADNLEEMA